MAELTRVSPDVGVQSIIETLSEEGGVIIEDLFSPEIVEAIRSEISADLAAADPKMKHLNPVIGMFFGEKTRHISGLAARSRTFACDVMCDPLLLEICDEVLLPFCASYQLNLGHLMDRGPGAERQFVHRDELVWVHLPEPHPEVQVATIIALEEFSPENGATCVVPGSNHWPRDRVAKEEEIAYASMSPGSALLYLGSTLHAGGANTTDDRSRIGVHMSYVLGWLRTEENNVLAVPPEIARELPRRAQELLGYGIHDALANAGGYLGMVSMRHPTELLDEGKL